jgi:hypothetical protein
MIELKALEDKLSDLLDTPIKLTIAKNHDQGFSFESGSIPSGKLGIFSNIFEKVFVYGIVLTVGNPWSVSVYLKWENKQGSNGVFLLGSQYNTETKKWIFNI